MKASRTLKRPILLAIAAILTVAVLASVAVTYALAADTPAATIDQYQVGMNGNLNLRFIYDSVSNVTGFKATVGQNTYNYTLSEVASGNKYVVVVPLAPSEVAADVTVTPMNGDTAGKPLTYSVEDYAKKVIATTDGYDDTMRALLNWGNASNNRFDGASAQVADVFARNSNPANLVTAIPFKSHDSVDYGTGFSNGTMNLALDRNNIVLSFYFEYSGEGTLTANLKREAVDDIEALNKNIAIEHIEGNKYRISVKNISVNLFNALYTLTVNDGTNDFVANASILEYLHNIITLTKQNEKGETVAAYDNATQKTARTLYNFYQLATGNIAGSECTHNARSFWVDNGGDRLSNICRLCYTEIGTLDKKYSELYMSADMLADRNINLTERENNQYAAITPATHFAMGKEAVKYENGFQYFTFNRYVAWKYAENGEIAKDDKGNLLYVGGHPNTAQFIWNRNDPAYTGGASSFEKYNINIGDANYFVFKARTTGEAKITLCYSTAGDTKTTSTVMPIVTTGKWTTYVVDLAKVFPDNHKKVAGATNYEIDLFYLHITPFADDAVIDIAYMAFVEGGWTDIDAIVDESTALYMAGESINGVVSVNNGSCIDHAGSIVVDASNNYIEKCAVCDAVTYEYGVSANDAKTFLAGPTLIPKNTASLTIDTEIMVDADGTQYMHFDNSKGTYPSDKKGPWGAINYGTAEGRYLIIKLRIGANGLGQTVLGMYTSTQRKSATDSKDNVVLKTSGEDAQWHTYVIDLAARVGGGEANGGTYVAVDGKYKSNFLRMDIFTGAQYSSTGPVEGVYTHTWKPQADDYFDIAYMAWCDELSDVSAIVKESTYEWNVSTNTNATYETSKNMCVEHNIDYSSADVNGDTVWTAKCKYCNFTHKTTVPAGTNFFGDLALMERYTGNETVLTRYLYDEEAGVLYNKITNASATHVNLTGGYNSSGTHITTPFVIGKYLIIKYRTPGTGSKINIGGGSGIGITSAAKVEHGTNKSTDWQVAVISLQSLIDAGSIPTTESTFYLSLLASKAVDVAYSATVDTLEEASKLIDYKIDATYHYYAVNFSSTPSVRNTKDNTCVECSLPTEPTPNGNVYEYRCPGCGTVLGSVDVPDGAVFKSPSWIANGAGIYAPNDTSKRVIKEENGMFYASMTDHIELIWARNQLDGHSGQNLNSPLRKYDIGNSRYLVIRMRSSNGTKVLDFTYSTTGKSSTQVTATADTITLPDGSYYDINAQKFEVKTVEGVKKLYKDGTTEELASVTYPNSGGRKQQRINVTHDEATDWCTYVIDLQTVYGDWHVKDPETGTYIIDFFYILSNDKDGKLGTFDIEYMAFVEDFEDIATLTDDTVLYNMTGSNTYEKTDLNGNPVE